MPTLQQTIDDFIADAAALKLLAITRATWAYAHGDGSGAITPGSGSDWGLEFLMETMPQSNNVTLVSGQVKPAAVVGGGKYKIDVTGHILRATGSDTSGYVGIGVDGADPSTTLWLDNIAVYYNGGDGQPFAASFIMDLADGEAISLFFGRTGTGVTATVGAQINLQRVK